VGWGGGGRGLTLTFKKKTPPHPTPPRKQIREFSVPIIDFTCHQIYWFLRFYILCKKKTLGGYGWVGGGLEFILFLLRRIKEKKFKLEVGGRASVGWMSAAHFPSVSTLFSISGKNSYHNCNSCSKNLDILGKN